jgi:hypothetical protein
MRRLTVLSFFFFVTAAGTAQYDYFAYENGNFQAGIQVYVFTDSCSLRQKPAEDAIPVVEIHHGDKVKIVYNAMVQAFRDTLVQYWYYVEYTDKNGQVSVGFISGHDLALGGITFQINDQRDLLLFQFSGFRTWQAYLLEAKIVRNGMVIQTIEVPFIDYHLNPEFPDFSISALKNIQSGIDQQSEVAEITFFHENPDFPSGILYLIWNGEHLARICETLSIAQPGLYLYDSYLVYPGRNDVKPGTVMQVEVIKEFTEEAEDYVETDRIITIYRWDGKSITTVEPK